MAEKLLSKFDEYDRDDQFSFNIDQFIMAKLLKTQSAKR